MVLRMPTHLGPVPTEEVMLELPSIYSGAPSKWTALNAFGVSERLWASAWVPAWTLIAERRFVVSFVSLDTGKTGVAEGSRGRVSEPH